MKFFRRRSPAAPPSTSPAVADQAPARQPGPSGSSGSMPPAEMTGTTTFGADNLAALFASHGLEAGGLLELPGQLVPEPENPADSNAVAIHVEGARVGYLPGYLAAHAPHRDQIDQCQVQLWGTSTTKGLRVRGWVALGSGPVTWPHTVANQPAVTTTERRDENAAAVSSMVTEALEGGGQRAEEFKRGMVGGYHYLETVEPIKQLKREGRFEEALQLCYGAIAAAERASAPNEPPPAYTEHAAIIHRQLGQRAEEEAVLRRWLALCPAERRGGTKIGERLNKLLTSDGG